MHQLSPHRSTIAQVQIGGLLPDGVVVVEHGEGSLVLLELRTGATLPCSAQGLEAAGHRHVLQQEPCYATASPTRFLCHYGLRAITGCPHRGSSLAWGLVGPLDWGRAPLGPHMCFDRRAHLVAAQGELTAHRSPPPTGPRGEVARMPVLVVATQCVPHRPKHPTGHLRPPNACHRQDTGSYSLTGFCAWFLFYTAHD